MVKMTCQARTGTWAWVRGMDNVCMRVAYHEEEDEGCVEEPPVDEHDQGPGCGEHLEDVADSELRHGRVRGADVGVDHQIRESDRDAQDDGRVPTRGARLEGLLHDDHTDASELPKRDPVAR